MQKFFMKHTFWVLPILAALYAGASLLPSWQPDLSVPAGWFAKSVLVCAALLYASFYFSTPLFFSPEATRWQKFRGSLAFLLAFTPIVVYLLVQIPELAIRLNIEPHYWDNFFKIGLFYNERAIRGMLMTFLALAGFGWHAYRLSRCYRNGESLRGMDYVLTVIYFAPVYALLSVLRHAYYQAAGPLNTQTVIASDLLIGTPAIVCAATGMLIITITRRVRPFPWLTSILFAILALAVYVAGFVLLESFMRVHDFWVLWIIWPVFILLAPLVVLLRRRDVQFANWMLLFFFFFGLYFEAAGYKTFAPIHYLSLAGCALLAWSLTICHAVWRAGRLNWNARFIIALVLNVLLVLILSVYELTAGWFSASMGWFVSVCVHFGAIATGVLLASLYAHPDLRRPNSELLKRHIQAPIALLLILLAALTLLFGGRHFDVSFNGINDFKVGAEYGSIIDAYGHSRAFNSEKYLSTGEDEYAVELSYNDACTFEPIGRITAVNLALQPSRRYPYSHGGSHDRVSVYGSSIPLNDIQAEDILAIQAAMPEPKMYTHGSGANPLNDGSIHFLLERDGGKDILSFHFSNDQHESRLSKIQLQRFSDRRCRNLEYRTSGLEINQVFVADLLEHITWGEYRELTVSQAAVPLRKRPEAGAPPVAQLQRGMVRASNATYTDPQSGKEWYIVDNGWAPAESLAVGTEDLPREAYHSFSDMEMFSFGVEELKTLNESSCKRQGRAYEVPTGSRMWQFLNRRVSVWGTMKIAAEDSVLIESDGSYASTWMGANEYYYYDYDGSGENNVWSLEQVAAEFPELAEFLEQIIKYEYDSYKE
ncbi:MAG: hypothetical protein KDK34_05065, partial [Leptospiraceae bacterium]|nr:hypothetical protein [Leptospiraceae bacterium]